MDEVFAKWDKPDSPGCALAVTKDGAIVYKRGYGMANLEYGIPITPLTIFHVASVSKQFTAMAVVLLALEGKLSLEDEIRKHLPELHDFGETIIICHLLNHTSGLRDQWGLLTAAGWRLDDVITTSDILELMRRQRELNFKPGAEYLYSNTGYTLLGVIVERLSGKSLRDFCAERIFKPLGMDNTHFHDDHRMIVKNRAYSYSPKDENTFQKSVLNYATVGATSLFTTVEDLAKWDKNFYDGIVGGKTAIELMQTRGVLNNGEQINYAFGLSIGEYRGLKIVEHGGGDAGYRAHLIRFPDQHFSVAILCNLSTMAPSELARQVADIYLAKEFLEEKRPEETATKEKEVVKLSLEELSSKVGLYYNSSTVSARGLELRGDKLYISIGNGIELLPLAPDRFRLAGSSQREIRFKPSLADGKLQLHYVEGNNKPIIFEAVKTYTPTAEEKASYAGVYYSPELDVNYAVILEKDQLTLQRRKYGSIPLQPTFKDAFTRDKTDFIVFSRDDENIISGFRLSDRRIRNLHFIRRRD
jgi:CubicO group peptidase (beta-lactamase class C family)